MCADKTDNVKTAGRTLDLFEVFARKRAPMSLSELAHEIGSPVSSTHALVRPLRARGFVYVLDDRRMIYPTKRILSVAERIAQNDPVVELALPALTKLQRQSDETVILGKRQQDHIVYLEVLESANSIRYSARAGDTKPLHSSSIGKAMLSLVPESDLPALLERIGQKRVTDQTITTDLAESRASRTFVSRGENVADVMGLATLVNIGNEAFGISIVGPMPRLLAKEEPCRGYLDELRQTFAELNRTALFA